MDAVSHGAARATRVPVTASTVNALSMTANTVVVTTQLSVAAGASIQTPAIIVGKTRIDNTWIAALAANVNNLVAFMQSGDIALLLTQMTAAQGAITALATRAASTEAALASAQTAIVSQGAALAAAQAAITSLASQVSALQAAEASLASRVTVVEELQTEDGARLTDVENATTTITSEVGEIETFLGELSAANDAGTAAALVVGGIAVVPPSSFVGRDLKMYGTGSMSDFSMA